MLLDSVQGGPRGARKLRRSKYDHRRHRCGSINKRETAVSSVLALWMKMVLLQNWVIAGAHIALRYCREHIVQPELLERNA